MPLGMKPWRKSSCRDAFPPLSPGPNRRDHIKRDHIKRDHKNPEVRKARTPPKSSSGRSAVIELTIRYIVDVARKRKLREISDSKSSVGSEATLDPSAKLLLESESHEYFDETSAIKQVILGQLGLTEDGYALREKTPSVLPCLDLNASIRLDLDTQLLYDDLKLTDIMTISGEPLASYGCPALTYIRETWPRVGLPSFAPDLLRRRQRSTSWDMPDDEKPSRCTLLNFLAMDDRAGKAHITLVDGDMLVCSGRKIRLDLIIDLVQLLCWLGIVLSGTPKVESLRLARSKLEFAFLDKGMLDIDFMVHSFPMADEPRKACWTPLLHGFHIAQNFPVPARSHGVGLEISLPMLAQICGAERAISFDGGLVMKGFSTMLVPKAIEGGIVQWHLVCSREPSAHLSYSDGVGQCVGRLRNHQISFNNIMSHRAVLGWWNESEVNLDNAAGKYSNAEAAGARIKVSEISLGFQQIGSGEVKISLVSRYSKFHFPRSGKYLDMLRYASRTPVLLFDVGSRRGWMLPATLVLLLTAYQRIDDGPWPQPACFEQGLPKSTDGVLSFLKASADVNLSPDYSLLDMISGIWASFEYLQDTRLRHQRESHGDINFQTRIIGFEYRAIVQDRSPLLLKQVKIKRTGGGWADLVRDVDALVLFGNALGELVKPLRTDTICPGWEHLPAGKDYLAVPSSLLLDFYETSGTGSAESWLTFTKLRWEKGDSLLFEPCSEQRGGGCFCHRGQQVKRGKVKNPGTVSDLSASPSAVVVFGSPERSISRNGSLIPNFSLRLRAPFQTVIARHSVRLRQFLRVRAEEDGTSTLVALSDLGDQVTLAS
ncbi:hypothetical protein B0T16DRAFT_458962 [Cercophora newfieldiana]|uniref:Uncharacterized protein n=1 Tax=Cercophora newfieldiana TaxID=92897 RepID=A0AA39Y9R5_9PEZI|nr:hypothetical protein B0T16DRAFT_458962 [Cercophora newfieldiana]